MQEFLNIITSFPTIVLTMLMALVLLFWISAILGAIDIDFFDFDVDADIDVDIDVDADADVDGEGTASGIVGLLASLGLSGVPLSVSMSLWVLFAWVACFFGVSLILQHIAWAWYFYYPLAAGLLLGSIVLTVPIAALGVRPLRGLFISHQAQSSHSLVGEFCRIDSLEVTENFGYARIDRQGEDFRINVWSQVPNELIKGTQALVIGYDKVVDRYQVTTASLESE